MEGRKSRALRRTVYSVQKRLLAFTLATAMILTNVGANINTAFAAGSSESITFSMSGSQLVDAIDEAIANGNEVTAADLDFTNGKIAEFEELFFGEGKVYEVFPEPEGGSMDAELRVFVRLPEDADDMYMVTGDEEVIFLYVNNGEDSISCTTEITRMDDGEEKIKKTKRVTVKSFEAAFGDEEINIISKPVDETKVPEETNGPAIDETAAPVESESQIETSVPVDDEITDAADETTTASDASTAASDATSEAADESSTTTPDETSENPEESQTEEPETPATSEAEEEKTHKADTADEANPEHEIDEPETDVPEKEAREQEVTEPLASIVRHYAPVVAENGENDEATEAKNETEAPKEGKEELPKETEAPESEEKVPESIEASVTEEEITETTEASVTEEEITETTEAATTEEAAGTTDGSTEADSSESASVPETSSQVSTEETTEAVKVADKASKASDTDLVGIGYCSTAKAYTTTVNQLKALDDFDGYKVSYAFYPEASGRIVEGPRGVQEGKGLTFGVKNQIGYAVESVTANDEILEADSITDNGDGSQIIWYSVPEIYEEQEIAVYTIETLEHPAFEQVKTINGVTITVSAPDGVLPAGTVLEVEEVTDEVAPAVTEKVESESTNRMVDAVMAYDINLTYHGVKLDNSWSADGYVNVTFSGEKIRENSQKADAVEIMHIETPKTEVEGLSTELVKTAEKERMTDTLLENSEVQTLVETPVLDDLNAGNIAVENIIDPIDVSGTANVDEVSFDVQHFSIYTITFTVNWNSKDLTIERYEVSANGSFEPVGVNADSEIEYLKIPISGNAYADYSITEIDNRSRVKGYKLSHATVSALDAGPEDAYAGERVNYIRYYVKQNHNDVKKLEYSADGKTFTPMPENSKVYFWYEKDLSSWPSAKMFVRLNVIGAGQPDFYKPGNYTGDLKLNVKIDPVIADYIKSLPLHNSSRSIGEKELDKNPNQFMETVQEKCGSKYAHIEDCFIIDLDPEEKLTLKWGNLVETCKYNSIDWYHLSWLSGSNWHIDGELKVEKDTTYRIEYYYDEKLDDTATVNGFANIGDRISKFDDKIKKGYIFDHVEYGSKDNITGPLEIVKAAKKNVIRVYYATDNNQRHDLSYTVSYYMDENWKPFKSKIVTVKNLPGYQNELAVKEADLEIANCQPKGYRFVRTHPSTLPESIINGGEISVYYEARTDYAVKYETNGGTAVEDLTGVKWDQTGLIPETPPTKIKDNIEYGFDGWYTDSELTTAYDNQSYAELAGLNDDTLFVTLYAKWRQIGYFKVWQYFPDSIRTDVNGHPVYGEYLDQFEDRGLDGSDLTYTDGTHGVDLDLAGVQKIVAESGKLIREEYGNGVRLENVYIQYLDPKSDTRWSEGIYATLDQSNPGNISGFPGLDEETFHADGAFNESRLHICYELPRTVQVEYWALDGDEYKEIEGSSYTIGSDPNYIYTGDKIKIATSGDATKDILKIAPSSYPNYKVKDVIYMEGDETPSGNEPKLDQSYEVKGIQGIQRVCVLIEKQEYKYKVIYDYDGVKVEKASAEAEYGTVIMEAAGMMNNGQPVIPDHSEYEGRNYAYDNKCDNIAGTIGADADSNTVTIYYSVDELHETDVDHPQNPDMPDGIPDKYQVVFTYVANQNGSVIGIVKEVVTRPQKEDGTYDMEAAVSPKAKVSVTPDGGYVFSHWNIDGNADKIYGNTDLIAKDAFTQNTTFIANFTPAGGGSDQGGGNSGGGGGGTSGGDGGSHRYNPPSGGPGATTINPEDVPLAQLPEAPVDTTMIDDGEIPLAALPKTGQSSVKTTLTMMMSGIFLILTALGKKRKEEDS